MLSQYDDDTTLILDGSEESFLESVILIETFGNLYGLRLNIKKTEAVLKSLVASQSTYSNLCKLTTKRSKKSTQFSISSME